MKQNTLTQKVTLYGVLTALALVLSWLESLVPAFFAVPGMKLGLTNLVVLTALYLMNPVSALAINIVRIFLVGLLFGNGVSLAYSLAGGMLSWAVMALLQRTGVFGTPVVSIAGGVAHNVGQIFAAMVILQTTAVGWYLLVLWFSGLAAGAVIGILGAELCRRLAPLLGKSRK